MTDVPVHIRKIWDTIPSARCKGLCQESCGPIFASDIERRILAEHGITIPEYSLEALFTGLATHRACPALVDGACSVYEVRPTVCRLWGATDDMPCEFGCSPVFRLSAASGRRLLNESVEHGQFGSRADRRRRR